jgi:hypothetical protein
MKKLLFLLIAFAPWLSSNAQSPPNGGTFPNTLQDLCFEQTYTERIRVG